MEQWWRSDELRNLLAHWLVDRGEIITVSALLAFYERPFEHEEAFRACMDDFAQGKERVPLEEFAEVTCLADVRRELVQEELFADVA